MIEGLVIEFAVRSQIGGTHDGKYAIFPALAVCSSRFLSRIHAFLVPLFRSSNLLRFIEGTTHFS